MDIVIIKLGAKGDVVRTLATLPAIRKKYPSSRIFWITKKNAADLLNNQYLDGVFTLPYESKVKFDVLFNFDIEDEATSLAEKIDAKEKYGFYKKDGYLSTFNLGAEYYLNTIFDDDLKKSNKKTYQEMMFEAGELPKLNERFSLHLNQEQKQYAEFFLKENNLSGKNIIGIHMGAGPRWPSKAWSLRELENFIIKAKHKGYEIILFGGPDEEGKYQPFISNLKSKDIKVIGVFNPPDLNFVALVNLCNSMVCSDSFALHVSLGLGRKTIALFFCTSPTEVEGYGFLDKVVSPQLYDFFPEKQDQFSEKLVNSITADQVLALIE